MPGHKIPYRELPLDKKEIERQKARDRYWRNKQAYLEEYGQLGERLHVYTTKYCVRDKP